MIVGRGPTRLRPASVWGQHSPPSHSLYTFLWSPNAQLLAPRSTLLRRAFCSQEVAKPLSRYSPTQPAKPLAK